MLKEKFDLTGKTALITGSTRGIGKAIGDAFEGSSAQILAGAEHVEGLPEVTSGG